MGPGHDLEAAYRATTYTAETPAGVLAIRIGETAVELDRLLDERGVVSWAYITAHNPGSIPAAPAENDARQHELQAAVGAAGYSHLQGAGVGPGWPPERSLLILGIEETAAATLARRFGQLAIVIGRRGEPARLLWAIGHSPS